VRVGETEVRCHTGVGSNPPDDLTSGSTTKVLGRPDGSPER
jgi:hypothetical protein